MRLRSDRYWVYMLLCDNGAYYTGYTNDLGARVQLHREGKGAKYTRSFKPVKLAQSWQFDCKSEALRMEIKIKKLTAKQKTRLVEMPESL